MKKEFVLLIVILIMMVQFTLYPAPIEPVRTLDVMLAYPAPVIDGIADVCYGDLQDTELSWIPSLPNACNDDDFTAGFRLCWDPEFLYIFAQFTDDIEHNYSWEYSSGPWDFDNFELYLQLDTFTVYSGYTKNTVWLRFCRGLDSVQEPGRAYRKDYCYYMESLPAEGWIAEIAIPWTAVYSEGDIPENIMDYADTTVIGFDFGGADSDNDDGIDSIGNKMCETFWDMDGQDGTETLAWNNTSVFGYITLRTNNNDLVADPKYINKEILFPNPASQSLFFPEMNEECSISVYDMQGMKIMDACYFPGRELNISELKPGVYIAVIEGRESIQFVKQ